MKRKTQRKLLKLFKEKSWSNKPDLTWDEIGQLIDLSGEAARSAWKRYRFSDTDAKPKDATHPHAGLHIVLGCMHVPFQNTKVLSGILSLMKDVQFQGLHLIGDFLDMNCLSSHDTGRFSAVPGMNLDDEYLAGNTVLDQFDALLPEGALKTYLYGNHEDRYFRWMADMQNSKTPLVSPENALKLKDRGYTIKTNWKQDFFTLGEHLELLHGIYFNVHTSKKHIDTLRGSVMFAHTHRIQTYIEGETGGFNIGWMGDKDSSAFGYASRAQKGMWQNGFATVYIEPNGNYHVNQIVVCEDKFVYNGKVY